MTLYEKATRIAAIALVPMVVAVAGLCYAAWKPVVPRAQALSAIPVASLAKAHVAAKVVEPPIIEIPTVTLTAPRPRQAKVKAPEPPKKELQCVPEWVESKVGGRYQICEWR